MEKYGFEELKRIVTALRAPDGCPWDRAQTHESMKTCLIEECYEVIEAIDNKDIPNLREELGDVLLQVVMHSEIAKEEEWFTLDDVIDELSRKLVRRHPHVFGGKVADTPQSGLAMWEDVKKQEKEIKNDNRLPLESVPKAFPANIRATKVLKKAEKEYGYNISREEVIDKIINSLEELRKNEENSANLECILLQSVNLSRILGENAENALTNAIEKVITRFEGQGTDKNENNSLL